MGQNKGVLPPGRAFQPRLMFAGGPGGAPSLLALPTNITLGWKGQQGKHTLAYLAHL